LNPAQDLPICFQKPQQLYDGVSFADTGVGPGNKKLTMSILGRACVSRDDGLHH
jgi:hypothetical protein